MNKKIAFTLFSIVLSLTSFSCINGEDGQDGKDGVNGQNGLNGKNGNNGEDGLSFKWLGEYMVFPDNPEKHDAFLNTVDGNSYIYDGDSWVIFAYGEQREEPEIDTIIDDRDQKKYVTIKIGKQIWFGNNLDFRTEGSRCFNDSIMNCERFGSLYAWNEALNGQDFNDGDPSNVQGICPIGWHLPSIGEWYRLIGATGGVNPVYLKSTTGWTKPGYDRFGMNILAGGWTSISDDRVYMGAAQASTFWTSSNPPIIEGLIVQSSDTFGGVIRVNNDGIGQQFENKKTLQYVRCVKNMP